MADEELSVIPGAAAAGPAVALGVDGNDQLTPRQEPIMGDDEAADAGAAAAFDLGTGPAGGPVAAERPASPNDRLADGLAAHLPPSERDALQDRVQRERIADERRQERQGRQMQKSVHQFYVSAFFSTLFLVMLLLKLGSVEADGDGGSFRGDEKMSWYLVFVPLTFERVVLGVLVGLETRQAQRQWLLLQFDETELRFQALFVLVNKIHDVLWHAAMLLSTILLPCRLAALDGAAGGVRFSIMACFAPVWLYAIGSLMWGWCYRALYPSQAATAVCRGWWFSTGVRVLPVLLVVTKVEGAEYTWQEAFAPLILRSAAQNTVMRSIPHHQLFKECHRNPVS
mmetsp:Transcript_23903/g.64600  ORF Transcript_23903/g.64600 Transcript_23903/m.64600 type:complete len:341 (-) Transcript_23903:1039-2061(-)